MQLHGSAYKYFLRCFVRNDSCPGRPHQLIKDLEKKNHIYSASTTVGIIFLQNT